jgi:RHS repeat-associated protein
MVVNSQTGEVVQRINYDAYGNITYLQNENSFLDIGFAGGLYDTHTGLIRFGARDYDPQTGRWTSKDPILFDGGTSNLYEYALNDPVNMVDPYGAQAIQGSIGISGSLGLFGGIGHLEANIGLSIDLTDLGNTKFFANTQRSASLGLVGAGYIGRQITVGITEEQLETGHSSEVISHTEGALGAGPVASASLDVPLEIGEDCSPENAFGIKGVKGASGSFSIRGGYGVAGYVGSGGGVVDTYTSKNVRNIYKSVKSTYNRLKQNIFGD